jgi:hypothetical protein
LFVPASYPDRAARASSDNILRPCEIKRTHTSPANGIVGNIEIRAKLQRVITIQDFLKRAVVRIPERRMEETGPDISTCLNDCGDPRSVTTRSSWFHVSEIRAKMLHHAAELFRALGDKTHLEPLRVLSYEEVNFRFQLVYLEGIESDLPLTLSRPSRLAIECCGRDIRGKKRN